MGCPTIWSADMTVRELYHESVKNKHTSLRLLIISGIEKNTVNFTDDKSVLDLFFRRIIGRE